MVLDKIGVLQIQIYTKIYGRSFYYNAKVSLNFEIIIIKQYQLSIFGVIF